MLTAEELQTLRAAIPADPDRTRLLGAVRDRAAPLLATMPQVPQVKAFLSRDGGVCPEDGSPLEFNPWSPEAHTCTRCGQVFTGDRHHRHWARAQHLWLAERMGDLAMVAALGEAAEADEPPAEPIDGDAAADRAVELIAAYDDLYFALPNRDNVLGPSHLFFSTYLESLWITHYLAAAFLLREAGRLPEERIAGVDRVADEAARIIGEFNEGFSNRQTWHAAALTAVAAWFGDEELARSSVEARSGILGHLADGFGADGLWWEGENYHLFALRGLMQGIHWARLSGFDLLDDPALREHFRAALLAPSRSALPDLTYPARRDSRYGVSLAQPASVELWEIGRAWLGGDPELDAWLAALYRAPPVTAPQLLYDAWLHDAGRPTRIPPARWDLSAWALTALAPAPDPQTVPAWAPRSELLADQGLAVLRSGSAYASVECGREIGGHGHPDRLQLTLHAGGVHWLPDPGTGSYVEPELAWYRSALAHNAPILNGQNAGGRDAWCEAFDTREGWAWCRARAGEARRTIVLGRSHLLDIFEVEAAEPREVILPWHLQGILQVETPGTWEPEGLEHAFVSEVKRLAGAGGEDFFVTARNPAGTAALLVRFHAPGAELLTALAPGLPHTGTREPFLFLRAKTNRLRWITVLDLSAAGAGDLSVSTVRATSDEVDVSTATGVIRYRLTESGITIEHAGAGTALGGLRPEPARKQSFFSQPEAPPAEAFAPLINAPPALDGTLDGFDTSAPLPLDEEHQYRRSEEPYDPEAFSATAWVNWDGEALYVAVDVAKPEIVLRAAGAESLELDNEAEDINADGVQIYLRPEGPVAGILVVPQEGGGLHHRAVAGSEASGAGSEPDAPSLIVDGGWRRTETGYVITLRLADSRMAGLPRGARIGFDLLVNEMQPGRQRRAGQLVWSGGGGWIYLRGDRHDPSQLGVLELG